MSDDAADLLDQLVTPAPIGREIPIGVRVLAPTGDLGYVPEEHLEEAIAAGAKVMNPDSMRELRQAVFMEHALFKHRSTPQKKRRRRSIVKGGRR